MVATRRRAAETSAMVEMILDSGCVVEILEFLSSMDLGHYAMCHSVLYAMAKDDFRLRWRQTVSRSWWSWFDRLEDQEYADDFPFKKLRRGGLEDDFVKCFAKTENEMLENIAAWCGGWRAFLRNRFGS